MSENKNKINIIGAGLAGCEAANYLANSGFKVDLYEMKPTKYSPAHKYSGFSELVCSNSLKAMRIASAQGLLKREMKMLCTPICHSIVLESAEHTKVDAGGALAVDRTLFSDYITNKIIKNKNITIHHEEILNIPQSGYVIIATGPLTSKSLGESIKSITGSEGLSFYDAAAPVISFESIDMEKAFFAARYGRGNDDYINCPFTKEQYEAFISSLTHAHGAELHSFDRGDGKDEFKVYEGCMPVEIMAKRGADTLRFGPLKPVGLRDPKTGNRPWAVVQLRKENAAGTLYNLVGFQTNLKFGEQKRVFSMIPSLENAEFVRYGVMHRNTFIDSPRLLDGFSRLKKDQRIFFAGQITGVEGYMESACSGILAGRNLSKILQNKPLIQLPYDTMVGALCNHIANDTAENFQPMGANMGLLPPLEYRVKDKTQKYCIIAKNSIISMKEYLRQELLSENICL